MSQSAKQVAAAAREAVQRGDAEAAQRMLAAGLAQYPEDLGLLGQAASLALRRGNYADAIALYTRAVAEAPANADLGIDLAIALTSGGDPRKALETLMPLEQLGGQTPRYWSVRANAARACGDMGQAATSYARCLALQPDHPRAMHGSARVALERGDDRATQLFDRALRAMPSEADLWLGKAQALDAAGRSREALDLTQQLVDRAPQWIDALNLLAQLRSAAGDADFDERFREATKRLPHNADIPAAHIQQLTARESYAEAAEIAAEASARFASQPFFALSHAASLGMAGELDEADRLFAELAFTGPQRSLQEGRQRLRRGDMERAQELLLEAAAAPETAHTAYALLGSLWRLTRDQRAFWLHEQVGLVATVELPLDEHATGGVVELLGRLHDRSDFPVGQSLRGGTQTRHVLFHRHEPELQQLHRAIEEGLETYRTALPPADPVHPLLRHRDDPWTLAGSWSVRLKGGSDRHASHIHPQGMLSSALYLVVPETDGGQGCLEIGRPPPDLRLDLEPLHIIQPHVGRLALFPSTLFHGTTPFDAGERMTVAFDVVPVIGQAHG